MTETLTANLLIDCQNILAEGIQWHTAQQRLYWTDIHGRSLWSSDADGNQVVRTPFSSRIGSFAFDADGDHLLLSFETGIYRYDPLDGHISLITQVEEHLPTTRLNDGRCDRNGNFLVGGVDEDGLNPISALYQYSRRGVLTKVLSNVGCSNGLCFSPDGKTLYFADSAGHEILAFDYVAEDAMVSNRRVFASLGPKDGKPDGSCIDADGGLWNARFSGGSVAHYGADGRPVLKIMLPVSQITCCCFGGPNLDRLYITSARENYTQDQIDAEPLSGGIFVVEPGQTGIEESWFGAVL